MDKERSFNSLMPKTTYTSTSTTRVTPSRVLFMMRLNSRWSNTWPLPRRLIMENQLSLPCLDQLFQSQLSLANKSLKVKNF